MKFENILVTGGAGYIGSSMVKLLLNNNCNVVVIDNLAKGRKEFVDNRAVFYQGDVLDKSFLQHVFEKHDFQAVIHFAAWKDAGESMVKPEKYSENIIGTINVLEQMAKFGVSKIIFSSTAAVYGDPEEAIVNEQCRTQPINYYGFSKLECERILEWYAKLHNISYVALRYFNVVGNVDGIDYIDPDAHNIFPLLMDVACGKRDCFKIFGNDYDTRDGTCIRDYIDLNDLIDAHFKSLSLEGEHTINIGTGDGFTVKECIEAVNKVTDVKINTEIVNRRDGDPECLLASNDLAYQLLSWKPVHSLEESINSMWNVYKKIYE